MPQAPFPRFVLLSVVLGLGFVIGSRAAGPEQAAVEVRGTQTALARVLGEMARTGARIRLVGDGYALVVVDTKEVARIAAELPGSRVLGTYDHPPALYQLRESELDPADRARLAAQTLYLDPSDDLRVIVLGVAQSERAVGVRLPAHVAAEEMATLERDGVDPHPLPDALPASAFLPLPESERLNPYRTSRLGDPTVRARARGLAGEVDAARLEQTVRDLSNGPGRTRFSGRPEVNTFARQYLLDSLRALFTAPGDTVIDYPFTGMVDGFPHTLYNVIARRHGMRPGSGKYVLGAHYDSIALRTEGWNSATDPAPGADDNASGTACVLEAARVLLADQYDFDLEFCFFGGEEQGLQGSHAYVDFDSANSRPDQVLGAIVLDMVAYNPRAADSLNLISNFTSEWLADLVREGEAALSAADGLDEFDKVVEPTLGYSDHGSYWAKDASAVLLIENTQIVTHNPRYHRVNDDLDYLLAVDGPDLMRRATEVVVATLGQFAIGPSPGALAITIPNAGLLFHNDEGELINTALTGQTITTRTRLINEGPSEGPIETDARVFLSGDEVGREQATFEDWGSGVTREILVPLPVPPRATGNQSVRVDVTVRGEGGRQSSLTTSASLAIAPLLREDPFLAPNPARSLDQAEIRLRPIQSAEVTCRVIDARGNEQGRFTGRVTPGSSSRVKMSQVVDELPSGIYIVRLEMRAEEGGPVVVDETLYFALTQ